MEQKRLGLISKAMLTVPGHCLAQASREFLQLYPGARILVADETNFSKDKRGRFILATKAGGVMGKLPWEGGTSRKHLLDAIPGKDLLETA